MNVCVLSGNLGADPESKYTSEGTHIVNFDLAFRSGKERTSWIKVTCFNKVADAGVKYLHKGARIIITGALDLNKWTTDEGEKRSMMRLLANHIEVSKNDGRGFEGDQPAEGNQPPDDDMPF